MIWSVSKRYVAILLLILLATSLIMPLVYARTEARYELRSGDLTFGNDLVIGGPQQTLFHQLTADRAESESTSVSFPSSIGMSQDTNIALPSISQRVSEAAAVSDTGFYTSNYCYCPGVNYGNAPLTTDYLAERNKIAPGRLIGSALLFPEMVNTAPGEKKYDKNVTKSIDKATPIVKGNDQLVVNSPSDNSITPKTSFLLNDPIQQECPTCTGPQQASTALNTTGIAYDLSYERFNMSANKSAINNMSVVDRMWRNSHLGGRMWTAYQGDTSLPSWVAPFDRPSDTIPMTDHFQVIKDSLNMTLEGTHLTPRFWRL